VACGWAWTDPTVTDPAAALLGRGGKGGVFYLHGADEFQKLQAVTALVNAHLDPATADFNLDRLRGRELDLEQLASILNTPPMMAEWRVVVVSETEGLAASSRAKELLLSTAEAPPAGLALILSCTVPSGSKARFYRDLASAARSAEFKALSPDDVPGWLMERSRERLGVEMEPDAAQALAQAVGVDLGILNQELEKLSGYVEAGRPITRADVEAAGTSLPSQDRWGWIGLVGARRFKEALDSLRILMSQGESGVGLTISLATHMLRLAVLVDRGRGALEEALPGHQRWLAGKLMAETRGWSLPELVDAVDGLRVLDRQLKSSGASDEALLQTWLLERMAWRPR
jgi:DNA polymerase-3 subunit delta